MASQIKKLLFLRGYENHDKKRERACRSIVGVTILTCLCKEKSTVLYDRQKTQKLYVEHDFSIYPQFITISNCPLITIIKCPHTLKLTPFSCMVYVHKKKFIKKIKVKIAIEKFWCVKYYKAQPYNMEHTLCVCCFPSKKQQWEGI